MKLFIPGPVWVRPEVLAVMAEQPIGHRSKQFSDLYGRIISRLQEVLFTKGDVFLSTSSGSGAWEVAVRNCIRAKALAATCGAFGERWADVAEANGKQVDRVSVDWARANTPDRIADALNKGPYDALLVVHNETSTGVTNPLPRIAEVLEDYPDTLLLVDAVSSMAGLPLKVDEWGIDIALASAQKAFALPPGLAIFTASEKALARAKEVEHRGFYFDLLNFKKYAERGQTPTTPSLPHIYALDKQLDDMLAEGMDARWARHREMAELVRGWAREKFALFAEEGYESDTVTCIKNTRDVDVPALNKYLLENHDCILSDGYGKLKGQTFRIGHMGDVQKKDLEELLGWIDTFIG